MEGRHSNRMRSNSAREKEPGRDCTCSDSKGRDEGDSRSALQVSCRKNMIRDGGSNNSVASSPCANGDAMGTAPSNAINGEGIGKALFTTSLSSKLAGDNEGA